MTDSVHADQGERFAIRYLTKYSYEADVVDSLNALRVKPAANDRQRIEEFSIRLSPDARLHRHDDYFGTEVVEFEVTRPHRELVIDVSARVATQPQPEPSGTSWEQLRDPRYREAGSEFLSQTEDAPGHPLLAELHQLLGNTSTPLDAAQLTYALIPARFEYRPGATHVDSTIADVLDGGAGVCQDFVHLGLNLLRYHGIAARYVSGYLFTASTNKTEIPDPTEQRSVEVETHAWIEALLPSEDGDPTWVSIDPTNHCLAGERHVKIGHGRCYADVPPIKGVYRGVANSTLEASVSMTRVM